MNYIDSCFESGSLVAEWILFIPIQIRLFQGISTSRSMRTFCTSHELEKNYKDSIETEANTVKGCSQCLACNTLWYINGLCGNEKLELA